jgi:hypothetical protein
MPSFEESSRVRNRVRPGRKIFDLPMARKTLPLVRAIALDAVQRYARHAHLTRELDQVKAGVRTSARLRASFTLADEADSLARAYRESVAELSALGALLLDPVRGHVGFATLVNGSLAYLVIDIADDDIRYWRYRNQPKLRKIPDCWNHEEFFPAEAVGATL